MSTSTGAGNSLGGDDSKRRGRKRGKHNFEPGYKDLLFDEWVSFSRKHKRCPKMDEVATLSERAFLARRQALKEEDPYHPHLSILEAPLDAVQVKNLVNNEKRRRSKLVSHFPQGGQEDVDDIPDEGGEADAAESPRQAQARGKSRSHKGERAVETPRHERGSQRLGKHAAGRGAFQPDPKRARKAAAPAASHSADTDSQGLTSAEEGGGCETAETASIAHHPVIARKGKANPEQQQRAQGGAGAASTSQPAVPDLAMVQETLKEALNAHLAAMSPQQQLALFQLHQHNQQQASMQQALASLTGQSMPGMTPFGLSPANQTLFSLFSSPPAAAPHFAGMGGFVQPPPAQPSLSQVMQMMQMFQQGGGGQR